MGRWCFSGKKNNDGHPLSGDSKMFGKPAAGTTSDEFEVASDVPASAHHVFDESSKQPDIAKQGNQATSVDLSRKKRSQTKGLKLEDFDFEGENVDLDDSEVDDVQQIWGHCLVGYFSPRFPGKQAVSQLCDSWDVNVWFYIDSSGWVIFKFENEMDSEFILQGSGPYSVFGKRLLLKPIPACFELDDVEAMKYMPVWIQLPGLPIDCWNATALSKIASRVGTPLCTDMLTRTKGRISFARILVEVDVTEEIVRSIQINLPVGNTRVQSVVYEYEPRFCSSCEVLGHASSECTTNN